jgi:hypothetical protein
MGLFDSISRFLDNREGDFVKLSSNDKEYGPGPLMILYNVPEGIDDEEIRAMIHDGAPRREKNCILYRTSSSDEMLDLSLEEALEQIVSKRISGDSSSPRQPASSSVLFFSGFGNDEMMNVFRILGGEIYEETGGKDSPACAKAVPNAMSKPLRQILDEIAGDHKDAMQSQTED